MTYDPIAFLERVAGDVARDGSDAVAERVSREELRAFTLAIDAIEPFSDLASRWLVGPRGSGRVGAGIAGLWAWRCLLDGATPDTILQQAAEEIANNRYEAWEIRPITGITIGGKIKIAPNAYLCRDADISRGGYYAAAFAEELFEPFGPCDMASLVQIFIVEPALIPMDADRAVPKIETARRAREAFAARHRLAMGLVSGGPVEMPVVYGRGHRMNQLIHYDDGLFRQPVTPYFGRSLEVEILPLQLTADLIERMDRGDVLSLTIDRLLRSRLSKTVEDRIIDLGMAAEIALMHVAKGGGDGKGEITNKISHRAAWLLGADVDERARIAKVASDLYAARSIVVHTGSAPQKYVQAISEYDQLIVDVAMALLERGHFPDWKTLTLGG
ncbi:MAG: hypothetical protein ACK4TC_00970 [Sphingomonas pseudosanguinis]|uniref:hypothetical protein n=1 Tax=Sphingomonas pseudosanguinis TaxID=413712 RepID=UPI003919B34F